MIAAGVPVVKLNGTGNDFVLVDERSAPLADPVAFAVRVCDREHGIAAGGSDTNGALGETVTPHVGAANREADNIGADGVLLVGASERCDVRVRVINADGSEAEMCGNGMRCVARYLDEHDGRETVTVETLAGPIHTRVLSRSPYRVAVEMGIPVLGSPHDVAGFVATPVDLGNPHVVVRVDDLAGVDVAVDGPRIERDPRYPHGTNVHFVARERDGGWRVLHWERGAGATQACGTGAVAVAAVLIASGDATSPVCLRVPGGMLDVTWTPGERATLAGDAVREFERVVR